MGQSKSAKFCSKAKNGGKLSAIVYLLLSFNI